MRTYVRMIVCVHFPRFELVLAAGGRSEIAQQALAGRALALAPAVGSEQRVGEVSGAAEASGVAKGMALGEALARCPKLVLLTPDPVAVAEAWESMLCALESIGAAVEPARPGLAYFDAGELRALHGSDAATLAAAGRACRSASSGTGADDANGGAARARTRAHAYARTADRSADGAILSATARASAGPPRLGAGPTRFCSLAAALAACSRSSSTAGWRAAGAAAGRCARWSCTRAWSRAAAGASVSSCARRCAIRSASAWRCSRVCTCFPPRRRCWDWRSSDSVLWRAISARCS